MDRSDKSNSNGQQASSSGMPRVNQPDASPNSPDFAGWRRAARNRFFHFFNTVWLALGLLALAGLFLFPEIRPQLQFISAWVLGSYLLGLLLSKLAVGAARLLLPLAAWLLPLGVIWTYFPQFDAAVPEHAALFTVLLALLGFPILLSGALLGRWAALAAALVNTALLTALSRWAGGSSAITVGLVLLWMLLALVAWLYESALNVLAGLLQELSADSRLQVPTAPVNQTNEVPSEPIFDLPLEGWEQALSFEDHETRVHGVQVSRMTVQLAERVGITEPDLTAIRRGSLLHDIGKAAVPQHILHKPGPLTPEEWEIVRRHPEAAREMLENHPDLNGCLDIPYCHHERWDGTGYPRGLRGDEIPLAARIFALVDVWNALLTDQPYRAAWSEEAVQVYIRQQSGSQFDPHIAEVFLEMIKNEDRAV